MEEELDLGDVLLDGDMPRPMLDGARIKSSVPGVDGRAFRHVVRSMEEWQVRNACYDADGVGDLERSRLDAQLVDYRNAAFEEYEESATGVAESK